MSLHPGLEGWGWAVFKPPPGGLWLVLGLVVRAPILGQYVSAEDCTCIPGTPHQRCVCGRRRDHRGHLWVRVDPIGSGVLHAEPLGLPTHTRSCVFLRAQAGCVVLTLEHLPTGGSWGPCHSQTGSQQEP